MPYIELDIELLLLAANDEDLTELVQRIREMSKAERDILRRAIESVDAALDSVIIEERLERIRSLQDKK
jgi:4-hydroxy-3-methylbut-2-en-1-yl diphosphate synthase IspG/GcpE